MFFRYLLYSCLLTAIVSPSIAVAQSTVAAKPVVGLRENRSSNYALIGARVFTEPGKAIDNATILIRETTIISVGENVEIPDGYIQVDCSDKLIYPGLIDAWSEVDVPLPDSKSGYWNRNVTPERNAALVAAKGVDDAEKLRSQGITARLVAPKGGIVKGSSCVVLLSDRSDGRRLIKESAFEHLQLTVPRGSQEKYPNSPMGAVALLRQSMYDAQWYGRAMEAYRANVSLPRPELNRALERLGKAIKDERFVIDTQNERMAQRAHRVAGEFSLQAILRGSGREYRRLDEIVAAGHAILCPINFPKAPAVAASTDAKNVTLQELLHWELAPQNPAKLKDAGAKICLTTDGLDDPKTFLKQVRKAVEAGLDPVDALAAMTTVPAEIIGLTTVGRIEPGMLASLIITNGELLADKTKVLETWVAGEQFIVEKTENEHAQRFAGNWNVEFEAADTIVKSELNIELKDDKLSIAMKSLPQANSKKEPAGAEPTETEKEKPEVSDVKLSDVLVQRDRLTAILQLQKIDEKLPAGKSQLTILSAKANDPDADALLYALLRLPDATKVNMQISRAETESAKPESDQDENKEEKNEEEDGKQDDEEPKPEPTTEPQKFAVTHPLGAYGLLKPRDAAGFVIFRGATVWTCDQQGVIAGGDVLINDGKIVEVGKDLAVPPDCKIIDARGKHITPGLIDCHSHMGTDGGVNESGQAVTAEVRIGDFIDNSDIQIYRQLAGGLTIANILHGSANPIGGQNQVIKLRWGATMDAMRMAQAPGGIKFALGENVKRNQSRYPNSRMGVEQLIRDQFLAAREYGSKWKRWNAGERDGLPPRVDLQLQALVEVQKGARWIHCHSYRQDEILATLDVLEEFGIQIGTLQHILEGYKVADRMAKHGAMASAFSDWWAYKIEVFDAIPYNGALMHQQGVVVSFNSDDRELARHLNTEAAKATKYGGVPEEEALKFVTLNPAKQLRIDKHVGSIAKGKHADLVVWSGRPLSTLTRCEQTWIDGQLYFDLQTDQELRRRDASWHAALIQKALGAEAKSSDKKEVDEENRWHRHDIHCRAHGDDHLHGDVR